MAKNEKNLNEKQQIFVREYLADRNATRAAVAAGYAAKTAPQAASRLLRNVKVQLQISQRTEKLLAQLDVTAAKVLRGLADLAFFDTRDFFYADGSLKAVVDLDDVCAFALKGIDVQETTETTIGGDEGEPLVKRKYVTHKIRLADHGENLERLGRHFKLFSEGADNKPQTVRVVIEHTGARIKN
jgi:phage terminase small subunit